MPSLQSADDRFGGQLTLIEGGSGTFNGILAEPNQGEAPSYQFNLPRRILRVPAQLSLSPGMVIRTPEGSVFMIGRHGDSEGRGGALFRSFRCFEASGQFTWKRRGKVIDPVTRLEKDSGLVDQPMIWGAYEPGSIEAFDRQIRSSFETGRFITNADVRLDDVVNDMKVSRVDQQLGLRVLMLG